MPVLGYHCSHEQFPPSQLLATVEAAELAGFTAAMSSDHFHPWSERQGQSGLSWAWLGAAMQATNLRFGMICAPAPRYHPAIVAQAAATLAEMFGDRFWLALGSGQVLNEAITGDPWPPKLERNARLAECVSVIRALWRGETVTHRGRVVVEQARLYTRPQRPPLLLGAAVTPETAEWVAGWADGLLTVSQPHEQLRAVVERFRRGGGASKPMYLKVQISYARQEEAARMGAYEQWRTNVFPNHVLTDLRSPAQFDAMATFVRPDDLDEYVRISSDLKRHLEWLRADLELGFDELYLHNVNREQDAFIEDLGAVLPQLTAPNWPS
jgi:coenzyme F420-dependent glucose-6-phosphate dehydrogenase